MVFVTKRCFSEGLCKVKNPKLQTTVVKTKNTI